MQGFHVELEKKTEERDNIDNQRIGQEGHDEPWLSSGLLMHP